MSQYKRIEVLTGHVPGNVNTQDLNTAGVMVSGAAAGYATFVDNFGNTFDVCVAAGDTVVVPVGVDRYIKSSPAGVTAFGLWQRGGTPKQGQALAEQFEQDDPR